MIAVAKRAWIGKAKLVAARNLYESKQAQFLR